ncbi:MAG: hypothetical protein QM770_19150 [Tepidisphaeraceae bacterium]
MRYLAALLVALALLTPLPLRAGPYVPSEKTVAVQTILQDWKDDARSRVVPVKIYLPTQLDEPAPVVLVSHGLGGSREALKYVADMWSTHGYVVVAMQHVGSDESVWRGVPLTEARQALTKAANGEQFVARNLDVKFVLDELTRRSALDNDPLHGKVDLTKIAMTGHSFGAITTQAVIGQRFGREGGIEKSFRDDRITAAVAFSPSQPRGSKDFDFAFGAITIPVYHITGTDDQNPLDPSESPETRQTPYKFSPQSDRALLVLKGATHGNIGGGGEQRQRIRRRQEGSLSVEQVTRAHDLIEMSTLAFLDATLRGDEKAGKWLKDGAFAAEVGDAGTFESKAATPVPQR